MEFLTLKQTAETWCQCNGYNLLMSDEEERRIVFKNKDKEDVTFFVVCPEPPNKTWHVWSDNEDILHFLGQKTQDAISSCKERSLTEILNMVHKDLRTVVDGACQNAEKGSDTDEDFDFDGEDEDDDDYDDDAGYYQEDDVDALEGEAANDSVQAGQETADDYFTGDGSSTAVHRLLADMKTFKKSDGKFGVMGGPRGDNLFVWDIQLTDFPATSLLGKDLERYAKVTKRNPAVYMEMKFPRDYPMAPPFVRVLRPKFRFLTECFKWPPHEQQHRPPGHVTLGGSVCMEMLSRSGWRPTNDIESILVQIRAEIMSDEKARLEPDSNDTDYDEAEARQAFERMIKRYGWNN